jgi:nucleotide-binding universal stress UspA family protein
VAHVSHKLTNAFEGALAGGGDPATSPLYVFGPFLKLIVVAGVAQVTFGTSIWLVIFTIAMVSAMYRLVMAWVTDGSGGSGLNEEEFGSWAVKVNASITFIEYTLTFLVSMAALVTFLADRFPDLNNAFLGVQFRTMVAIVLSIITGWLVNRGPKMAARAFGPATAGVLLLLWVMIIATIWRFGFQLPRFSFQAFRPDLVTFTFGGYARILAVMTGIEIFANLVAAYDGEPKEKSRKAFNSLLIIMGTTSLTMLIVGPAIFQLADPANEQVSVFTQTMDKLLPAPLPWLGTIVGIAVLLSASAASAQGLQNLALGLKYRNYVPSVIGQRNRFEVADKPVWLEVAIVSVCFLIFGTHEETYLAIYAAGVFILLSMTGWAATKRLLRFIKEERTFSNMAALVGTAVAATLTSGATIIIFAERFLEGAWTYLLFIPLLYVSFSYFRRELGEPTLYEERLGRTIVERKYLAPFQTDQFDSDIPASVTFDKLIIPLDGSTFAEQSLSVAESICHAYGAEATLLSVAPNSVGRWPFRSVAQNGQIQGGEAERKQYLEQIASRLKKTGIETGIAIDQGEVAAKIIAFARDSRADLIVMGTHGRSGIERWFIGSIANKTIQYSTTPVLLLRPTTEWRSRWSQFKRLLVTVDGSHASERILPYARAVASQFASEVILLSVPEGQVSVAYRTQLQDYLQDLADAFSDDGIKVQAIVSGSGPARTIVQTSEEERADLIMLATHGLGGVKRLMLGSVADRVVRQAHCPIFLAPIPERRP